MRNPKLCSPNAGTLGKPPGDGSVQGVLWPLMVLHPFETARLSGHKLVGVRLLTSVPLCSTQVYSKMYIFDDRFCWGHNSTSTHKPLPHATKVPLLLT